MDEPDQIHLRDYVIDAEIGAFQSERGRTQRLRFNLTVDLADPVVGVADDVDRILSYDVLTDAIATAISDERFNLLETLAEKIAAEILAHPRAGHIRVTIEKLDRIPGALGVTLNRRRGRVDADAGMLAPVVLFHGTETPRPDGAVILTPDAPPLPLPGGGNERRVALLALDQAAWALGGRLGLDVADNRTELDWAVKEARPIIWAPARMAADIAGLEADPIAIALWLAERMGAQRLDLALPAGMAMPDIASDIPLRRVGE
ncbi:dihydroneopterin aldolase [Paracoccus aerodenitrificans]|uniref:dihydroneopterin aldolase n=1 Tax=Paracoccus aerodenitrificans TaxID=3017781 RepID=UPI0022F05449|nr:dihydroneopterin aldolase [Paracoccus aerodenitrificans]WBU65021.1 dihydroneopterin aldolase [Paracoccus aerodenitrificans]